MVKVKNILFVVLLLCMCRVAKAADNKFYVFLCIGQSNMVGQGVISKEDSIMDDRFMSLSAVDGKDGRKIGVWRKALPPICRDNTHLSPLDYFGRTALENLPRNARVGVVDVAVDGCAIDLFDKDNYKSYTDTIKWDWMKREIACYDGNPYKRLIDMARIAQRDGEIRGVLVHQGETDAYSDVWLKKVKKIYNDILKDLNLEARRVPLIVGEVVDAEHHGVCANANKTIDRIHSVVPTGYYVTSKGCSAGADNLHFDAAGYRLLGKRYGIKTLQAMGFQLVQKQKTEVVETPSSAPTATVDVQASLDEKGKMQIKASSPLTKIEVEGFEGKVIKSFDLDNITETSIDLNDCPDETLFIVFHAANGATNTIQIGEQQNGK
jgi:hypothetical protein